MNKSSSSEDKKFINYVFDTPSLKSIALVAVAAKIYGYPDEEDLKIIPDSKAINPLSLAQVAALSKLEEIVLPLSLKREVSDFFRFIQMQWREWCVVEKKYGKYCDLKRLYEERGSSYWTMEGMVDAVKLLKDIFDKVKETNDRKVDFAFLYEGACMYCIEEYIAEFWPKIPKENRKAKYYAARTTLYHPRNVAVAYWTASMNNELPDLLDELAENDRINLYDMDLSVCANMISGFIVSGNLIELRYFWNHKLTEKEKDSKIKNWINLALVNLTKECFEDIMKFKLMYDEARGDSLIKLFYDYPNAYTDIMGFLLSHLNRQSEQREVFRAHPKVILLALFTDWQLRKFFIPTITVMMDFLEEKTYVWIMSIIVYSIVKRNTAELVAEVWDISPLNLKKAFIRYLKRHAIAIGHLLFAGYNAAIDLILNYATAGEKKHIVFRLLEEAEFRSFLQSHSNSDKMAISAIDRLVSKTLSESDLRTFKENVMSRHAADLSSGWILSGDFESLIKLWNWASQSVEEIRLFKNDYIDLKDLFRSLLVSGNCGYANDFLNWYFDSEEEVSNFKKSFVHKNNWKVCRSLMRHFGQKGEDGRKFSCNLI